MGMVTNIQRMDWNGWLLGLMRSVVSGGAGAVVSSTVVSIKDPADWGTGNPAKLLMLMVWVFSGTALMHMFVFLQTHPTPDPLPQQIVANVTTETKITPVDTSIPATVTKTSTPVSAPEPPKAA